MGMGIVGAAGAILLVLVPLLAYFGYLSTRQKRPNTGRMWSRYGIAFEILALIFLTAWIQAEASNDELKEALAGATLIGGFAFILIFASAGYSHWVITHGNDDSINQ